MCDVVFDTEVYKKKSVERSVKHIADIFSGKIFSDVPKCQLLFNFVLHVQSFS